MDGQQMDQMARALARGMSRRRAVKGGLAALLGGLGGGAVFSRADDVSARRERITCPKGWRRCGKNECYRPFPEGISPAQQCCHCSGGIGVPADETGDCSQVLCPTI
jgi:hypothetical protein